MSLVKLVDLEPKPTTKKELKDYLFKCKELEIPLYYRLSRDYDLWFGHPNEKSDSVYDYPSYFNLSKISHFHGDVFIFLDDINDLLQSFDMEINKCRNIFIFSEGKLKAFDGLDIIKRWCSEKDKSGPYLFNYANTLNRKYLYGFKFENILSGDFLVRKIMRNYYFKKKCNECDSFNYEPITLNVDFKNIYLNQEDSPKLNALLPVTSIPNESPYFVPEGYRDNESLCKLAVIGYSIFEKNIIPEPSTAAEGARLIEKYGVFPSKNSKSSPDKPSKKCISAYFFINPSPKVSAKKPLALEYGGNQYQEPPYIRYLLKIDPTWSIGKKGGEINAFEHVDDNEAFAFRLLKN